MKKIITIGGWSGTFNVVSALKKLENVQICPIVSMSDDGGSTWFLRDEYGILPPGDIRRALVALADDKKVEFLKKLFSYRFKDGFLAWHNLGNLIMKASEDIAGDYIQALRELEKVLGIEKWKVFPITLEKTRLVAKLEDGSYIIWETNIDIPKYNTNLKIENFWVIKEEYAQVLKNMLNNWFFEVVKQEFESILRKAINDKPCYYPEIKDVILQSDYIIVGPGDLYTSILPNILVWDFANLLKQSKATKIYISNLFTKPGETTWFKLSNFLKVFEKYVWKDIFDIILVQDESKVNLPLDILEKYKKENKELVINDLVGDSRILKADLITASDVVRHNIAKLVKVLDKLIN